MAPTHNDNNSARPDVEQPPDRSDPLLGTIAKPLEAAAFWSAIALPFLYVPLLFGGLGTNAQLTAFLALLGFHALTIVGGYRYNRD
jgi:hypothetical protein